MTTHLFKITTTRDDVQVGWAGDEVGEALQSLSRALIDEPVMLWQYAVRRGEAGLEVAPHRQIALFRNGVLRIEPAPAEHPIVAIPPRNRG